MVESGERNQGMKILSLNKTGKILFTKTYSVNLLRVTVVTLPLRVTLA